MEELGARVRAAMETLARATGDRDAAIAVMLRLVHLRFTGTEVQYETWPALLAALPRDDGPLDPDGFPSLTSARVDAEHVRSLCEAVQPANPAMEIEEFGHVYESLLDRGTRRAGGTHFTPRAITELLVKHTLEPLLQPGVDLLSLRICDPACGAGAFLLQACRYLADRLQAVSDVERSVALQLVAERCLFGVDVDPLAVEIAKLSLKLLAGVPGNVRCADSLFEPELGPFDAIVCNPPFVNAIEGGIDDATKRRLALDFPVLGGTADYAYYFLERSRRLIRAGGTIGFILPRSFLVAPAAASLRSECSPSLIVAPESSKIFRAADVFITLVVIGGGPCRGGTSLDPAEWKPLRITSDNWWSPLTDESEVDAGTGPNLGDAFELFGSMTAPMAYELVPHLVNDAAATHAKLLTTGLIEPDACLWGTETCRYLKADYSHPAIAEANLPADIAARVVKARRPKVIVAGLGKRLEAYFDRAGEYCGAVQTFTILHRLDDLGSLQRLCTFLNSPDATRLLNAALGANALGGGSITVKKRFLASIPLPNRVRLPE